MKRALTFLTLIAACAEVPQADPALPAASLQKPAFLTPEELAQAIARAAQISTVAQSSADEDLRRRAEDLRGK